MVHTRVAFALILLAAASSAALAGICNNAASCSTPCPATDSCYSASDCGPGGRCEYYPDDPPFCMPIHCDCHNNSWQCSLDCAGFCNYEDIDGDGVFNQYDNCPTVANPQQSNCDHDAMGDACDACPCDAEGDIDGDTVCGNHDNCRYVSNPSQADADADGLGDPCDCAPLDAAGGAPAEVSGLLATSVTRFDWSPDARAENYDIARMSLLDHSLVCWTANDQNPLDTHFIEPAAPNPGNGWGYLVRGVDQVCGGAGPWDGWGSGICP